MSFSYDPSLLELVACIEIIKNLFLIKSIVDFQCKVKLTLKSKRLCQRTSIF